MLGSLKPVCGVNNATLPSCFESKLAVKMGSELQEPRKEKERDMPFEQNDLVWCHPVQILPFVIWVIFDRENFSLAVRIDE